MTNEEMLKIIIDFITDNGYPPTTRELCEVSGIESTSTMNTRLHIMRARGLIDFVDYEPRTLSVAGYRYVKE